MMLLKLPGLRKFSALKEKKITITASPISTGQLPRVPPRMLSSVRAEEALGQRRLRLDGGRVGAHAGSGLVDAIPATFVGTPAVIAWTTSCCVVFSRS